MILEHPFGVDADGAIRRLVGVEAGDAEGAALGEGFLAGFQVGDEDVLLAVFHRYQNRAAGGVHPVGFPVVVAQVAAHVAIQRFIAGGVFTDVDHAVFALAAGEIDLIFAVGLDV